MKDGQKILLNGTKICVQDIGPTERSEDQEKRWEDDINDFLKQILEENENEEPIERRIQNNNNWINIAKVWRTWARLEGKYTMNCVK